MLAVRKISWPSIVNGCRMDSRIRSAERGALVLHCVLEQDRELVAAHAGDRVARSQTGLQAVAGSDEQVVACCVPETVVDHLEAVEVEEQNTDVVSGASRCVEGVLDTVAKTAPGWVTR